MPTSTTLKLWCNLPTANLSIRKCLEIHVPKHLRRQKLQVESCCLLKTTNLQTPYPEGLATSVEESTLKLAPFTLVEKSRTKSKRVKPPLVNQQFDVYCFTCDLCCAGYVGYTCRQIHQQIEEQKGFAVGHRLGEPYNKKQGDIKNRFKKLRKYQNKFDCRVFEMCFSFILFFFFFNQRTELNKTEQTVLFRWRKIICVVLFYWLFVSGPLGSFVSILSLFLHVLLYFTVRDFFI